jgi:hypothetical protein
MLMKRVIVDDSPKIPTILEYGGCRKHNAIKGIPCFLVPKSNGFGYYAGVCGRRAKTAGFNAPISPSSLSLKRPTGTSRGKRE